MKRTFTLSVYKRRHGNTVSLTPVGIGSAAATRRGTPRRAEEQTVEHLRKAIEAAAPAEVVRFELRRGTKLERVRLELSLKDAARRKVSGLFPVVVEPRFAGEGHALLIAYHPERPAEWFPAVAHESIAERAAAYFETAWKDLDDDAIEELRTDKRDSLGVVSFDATPRSILHDLPSRQAGIWDDLEVERRHAKKRGPGELKILPSIGVDATRSVAHRDGREPLGLPRSPLREQLEAAFAGPRRRSLVLVGPPGSGKSTLIRQLMADTLAAEGFDAHKNLDKVTRYFRVSGKTIIAGMSRVGEWEKRCVDVCDDVRERKIVLLLTDLHLFGRIGKARDSERALSDFFRGPVARGEVVVLAECTPDGMRRLTEDDASFAAAFRRFDVPPTDRAETFRMMLARAREIERATQIEVEPSAYDAILELGSTLYPARALPGKAVDLLVKVAGAAPPDVRHVLRGKDVVAHLSADTGLPRLLLTPEEPLDASDVRASLESKVMGQETAITEAVDLVMRIRAGLTDPKRPWGVFLFTGPTGTGKTELAKVIAEYLYGASSRLARFDMSELSGRDAVERLVGGVLDPEGLLTNAALAQPFGVILLDEIEKAHPSVLNLLLQLFEDGRLTDAAGTTADFTRSVIVMTSNLGARRRAPVGFDEAPEGLMHSVDRAVREFFPPELFNRIDAVVPFRPLTPEVAVQVTQKALSKLFSRAGLLERDVFVDVEEAAVARIADDALRAEDGARSLTRFIEDRIGTLLVEHIAAAPAALQVVRVAEVDGALSVRAAALTEATPIGGSYALEDLWDKPLAELRAHLPEALATVERVAASDTLALLCERLRHHLGEHNRGRLEHGAPLFQLDWMRLTLDELRARLEALVVSSRDVELEAVELAIAPERPSFDPEHRRVPAHRLRVRRAPVKGLGRGMRWETFSAIAETYVVQRALDVLVADAPTSPDDDPNAAIVTLEAFGKGRRLLSWMARAYAGARGSVDELAARTNDGVVTGAGPDALTDVLARKPQTLVLKLVGLCMYDYLRFETGTHVWKPFARDPELLRVDVTPVGRERPRQRLEERERIAKAEVAWLPIVRTLRFDPPAPGRPATLLEADDHGMGTSFAAHARDVADVLAPLWLLRVSREAPQGARAGSEGTP